MIEDLDRHKSTKFTCKERIVDKALRFPFFDNLEEIDEAYEIKELKDLKLKRPSQGGIAVYQLAKWRVLYYDNMINMSFIMILLTSIPEDKILSCVTRTRIHFI